MNGTFTNASLDHLEVVYEFLDCVSDDASRKNSQTSPPLDMEAGQVHPYVQNPEHGEPSLSFSTIMLFMTTQHIITSHNICGSHYLAGSRTSAKRPWSTPNVLVTAFLASSCLAAKWDFLLPIGLEMILTKVAPRDTIDKPVPRVVVMSTDGIVALRRY